MDKLVNFVREARQKGFSDSKIQESLLDYGWNISAIEKAFSQLNPKFKIKNQVCVFLSNELLASLEKRAKKNMFTMNEQIEDILRRSCIRRKTTPEQEKLDDLLITCFSRARKGRKPV